MKTMTDVTAMSPNQLVSWFMIASFAYYRIGGKNMVMEDYTFDYLIKLLREKYDDASHYHKALITEEHLDAGTGYDIAFPTIVKCAYNSYVREHYGLS